MKFVTDLRKREILLAQRSNCNSCSSQVFIETPVCFCSKAVRVSEIVRCGVQAAWHSCIGGRAPEGMG